MLSSPSSDLQSMLEAALAGARATMRVYGTDFAVELKADASPVSVADRESERAIVERLATAFPGIAIVAEEAYAEGAAPDPGQAFLLVDPLDGTKEFIRRNGEFTVNIALIEDGVPTQGIVLAPALGLAYAGGHGAAFKGTLGAICDTVEGWTPVKTRPADENLIAVASRSHSNPATEDALRLAGVKDRRSIGSSLKFGLLADGEADFYPRFGPTMEWDIAAGDAVLRAAGGAVVNTDGTPFRYGKTRQSGMRDFENPHFVAVGDPTLLQRLPLHHFAALKAA